MEPANPRNRRNVLFISISQLGIAFSFNFVMVFLPFFIHRISPYSTQATLLWVGIIMGCSSGVAALASTFWGSLASHVSPKKLYMRGLLSHTISILLMAFVSNLPLLLVLRIVQGILGGISTLGLIMVSASTTREWAAKDIGFFQNSLTLGQLAGPPVGAFCASMLGYRSAFIGASALVFVSLVFCFLYVVDVPGESRPRVGAGKNAFDRKTLISWALCFTTTIQIMFLPSILPDVFESFHVARADALKWAGLVVMFYTTTAMIGTYFLCRLSSKIRIERLIVYVSGLGIILQCLFSLAPGIVSLVVLRLLQTALIAAIIPLTISLYASSRNGKVIGFLNSGRFAGNAIGPMIGTAVLAFSNLSSVYLFVGGLGIFTLAGFAYCFRGKEVDEREGSRGRGFKGPSEQAGLS